MLSNHRLSFLEGEDSAQVLVRFADGSVGAIVTSWAYDPPGSTEKFSVVGEGGSMWSDGTTLHVKPRGGEVAVEEFAEAKPHTIALEVVDFIDCLREGRRPLNTEVDGIRVLKVILAAYASADQKRIVGLGEVSESAGPHGGASGCRVTLPASSGPLAKFFETLRRNRGLLYYDWTDAPYFFFFFPARYARCHRRRPPFSTSALR